MTDEAPSTDWVGIPQTVEVANSTSNSVTGPEHTNVTSNSVLGLECFSWARVSDGLPAKQPVPDFLYRLMCMLLDGPKDVIEWQHGKIIIHNPSVLESDLLKQYFRHSNFMSFKRQLNYFGFRKLSGSKEKLGPCVYMNENVGPDIKKLLTIKRRYPTSSMKSQESIHKVSLDQDKKDVSPEKMTDTKKKWPFVKSDDFPKHNNELSEVTMENPIIRRIRSSPEGHTDFANAQLNCAFSQSSSQGVLSYHLSAKSRRSLSSDKKSDLGVSRKSSMEPSWLECSGLALARNVLCESPKEKKRLYQPRGQITQVNSQDAYMKKEMPDDLFETAACFPKSCANNDVALTTSKAERISELQGFFFSNTYSSSSSYLPDDLRTNFDTALRQSKVDGSIEANESVQSNQNNSFAEAQLERPLADTNFHSFPSDSDMMNFFHHGFDSSSEVGGISRESSLEHLARIPSRSDISAAANSCTSMHSYSSASLHVFDDE